MKVVLETERLRLREFVEEDAESLWTLDTDPEVMRYINSGKPISKTKCSSILLRARRDSIRRRHL